MKHLFYIIDLSIYEKHNGSLLLIPEKKKVSAAQVAEVQVKYRAETYFWPLNVIKKNLLPHHELNSIKITHIPIPFNTDRTLSKEVAE